MGYKWKFITARVSIFNVWNSTPVTSVSGAKYLATAPTNSLGLTGVDPASAQYFFQPGRSYQATLGVSF